MTKMSADTNALNWFEIPILNVDRAKKFYETIFDMQMQIENMPGDFTMVMFPSDSSKGKSGGALVKSEMHIPSAMGALIYLNANPNLQIVLDKIEAAGGKIRMPKTLISEDIGAMAIFTDTEGNTVALHSNK